MSLAKAARILAKPSVLFSSFWKSVVGSRSGMSVTVGSVADLKVRSRVFDLFFVKTIVSSFSTTPRREMKFFCSSGMPCSIFKVC